MTIPRRERDPRATVALMLNGAWVCQTISSVTRLDVPDLLQKYGPLTARQLTEDHGVDARSEFLERALRACASVGLFIEHADGRFGPTPLSEVLTLSSPGSMKNFAELYGGDWWKTWAGLPDALRTGEPQQKARLGVDHWESEDSEKMEHFGEAMKAGSLRSIRALLEQCDFSQARAIVDVGGGFGHLAIALLQRYPRLLASVLDLPDLVPIAARRAGSEDSEIRARLSFVGGDMFADVPEGDTYILKRIIHDWDDESSLRVLENCRSRMPDDGRVLCVDAVLPPMGDTSCPGTKLLDLLMMVSLPGKERTEAEWRSLFDRAGLRVTSIRELNPETGESVIEGAKRAGR